MNTIVTSREEILKASRGLAVTKGWNSVNMRSVAAACGIAVGSLYNYFGSKSQLVAATVESVWLELFHMPGGQTPYNSFLECAQWIYQSIKEGSRKYPGFFTLHSIGFAESEKEEGKKAMGHSFDHIQQNLLMVLSQDPDLRPGAFDGQFTEQGFTEMIFSLIISSLLSGGSDFYMISELIRRSIY